MLCGVASAQSNAARLRDSKNRVEKPQRDEKLKPIDLKSRRMLPVHLGDSTAIALAGDVVAYHEGAVITCDSLIRYSPTQITCFGKVVVNKDDTYIYGDRAEYNGTLNEARIFSPLVKVMDNDAVLYTYNFKYNTKKNVGEYYGGGTFSNGTNTLESDRGFFYGDLNEVVGVGHVNVKNETYRMKSDSVNYNTDTEVAEYFSPSVIWNDKHEILSSDDGWYDNRADRYIFRSNAYVLSDEREIWADSIDYHAAVEQIEMRHNIQLRDEGHSSILFGDYGEYDGQAGDTFLTRDPSFLTYGTDSPDTVYMRSDSMWLYKVDSLGYSTFNRPDSATLAFRADSTIRANRMADSLAVVRHVADSLAAIRAAFVADSLAVVAAARADSLAALGLTDSLAVAHAMPADTLANTPADTLNVGADQAVMVPADSVDTRQNRILVGLRDVKIFRNDFQGVGDSIVMFSVDSTAQLHRNAVMWNELNQIVGDRADIYTRNQKPYRIVFTGAPMMSSQVDTAHYNQVEGKTIESLFDDGAMYRTNVTTNVRTYYYMVDDADHSAIGFQVIESADMNFFIEDNAVTGIMYRVDPVYTFYPMDKIPADQSQRLPSFVWYIDRKPTWQQIIGGRVIRASQRERYLNMKEPQFPLTYGIERYRESLVSGGTWVDRTDKLTTETVEFVEKVKARE